MYDIELLYHALNRIAGAIERIINNSKDIDDPQYYLLSPAGMERLAMGIRDIIAHHYFDIDEAIVFDVVKNKLPDMLKTIRQMIEEL